MMAHTIGAVSTIADLGPIAGIGNSSIVIVSIVSIAVVIINNFFVVIVSNVVAFSGITSMASIQRPPSSNPQKLPLLLL